MKKLSLEDIIVSPMENDLFLDTIRNKWFYYNRVFGQSNPEYWIQLNRSIRLISDFLDKNYFEPIIFAVKEGQVGHYLYLKINVNNFPSAEDKMLFTKVCRFVSKIEVGLDARNALDLTSYFGDYNATGSNGLFLSPMFRIQ